MILRELYNYYWRIQKKDNSLPPIGFKEVKIHFIVVISKDGEFRRLEDRRFGKNDAQRAFVLADSRSSGIKPYAFYDNIEYVFGTGKKANDKKTIQKFEEFKQQCSNLSNKYSNCHGFKSVCRFYERGEDQKVKDDSLWQSVVETTGANISFLVEGNTQVVASNTVLSKELEEYFIESQEYPPCLITGLNKKPVELTTATMIPGSQATAKLVAFQENSGYDSFGKTKCYNAPISKEAESAYTSALLKLLDSNSRNKFLIGNRTYLFWSSSDNESSQSAEESFASFLSMGYADDPNAKIEEVRKVFESIYSGKIPGQNDDKFFILGLAPNSARLSVVYWQEITIKQFAEKILQHFNDLDLIDNRKYKRPYQGLKSLMGSVTLGGKSSDAQPNLIDATVKAIIEGTTYPTSLFTSALRRIRSELDSNIQICRVAIIKGYLNRINSNNKILKTMLNKTYSNEGYLCGRLFAVIEHAQFLANGIDTVRERYMNAASATPATVFPTLLNLSTHHIEKLKSPGFIESLKREIISLMPHDSFPSHLNLQDQGRFFIGYYQQKQDLYKSKND